MASSKFTPEQRSTIEEAIIAALDAGVTPWAKPWAVGGPRNFTTGSTYKGMLNAFLLAAYAGVNGWGDDWAGAGQVKKAGGRLVKDAKPVGIFAPIIRKFMRENEDGTETLVTYTQGFREVTVYNAAQVEGVEIPAREGNTDDPIESADALIAGMPEAPAIYHGGDVACYKPCEDVVWLPNFADFDSAADYYGIAFHELAHSTGAESRLNRPGVADFDRFGSEQYAVEELVAEMTSAHLVALAGLDRVEKSAGYMASWSKALKNDRTMILDAMDQAAESVRWIEGTHHKVKALTTA